MSPESSELKRPRVSCVCAGFGVVDVANLNVDARRSGADKQRISIVATIQEEKKPKPLTPRPN
jgi:hypothetical protein